MKTSISETLKQHIPDFKIGLITYHDIVVSDSPQLIKEQINNLEKELMLSLEGKSVGDLVGVKEWRKIFKTVGTDASRYRPSQEALIRRLHKGQTFPLIHSAADLNNYFSVRYEIPLGIYDLDHITDPITIQIGTDCEIYEALNGRKVVMEQKIVSTDSLGAFGSPIVDSKRTMTTSKTRNALQIVYFKPSDSLEHCNRMLQSISELFTKVNSGKANSSII